MYQKEKQKTIICDFSVENDKLSNKHFQNVNLNVWDSGKQKICTV